MAKVEVRLLGRPVVLDDGVEIPPPKGAKPWGLLAYLCSTRQSHPRTELAELLFGEAADPLGALRWNLAALRRLFGQPDALKGDAIGFDIRDVVIDVRRLDDGELRADAAPESSTLLAGMSFGDSPMFELWLTAERARLRWRVASLRREGALRALAAGDVEVAVRHATALVAVDPLDEGYHALLIRALVIGGDRAAAREQFEQCREILGRELSIEPGPAVVAAVHLGDVDRNGAGPLDRQSVDAHMTVAWQSFLAGSVDHGIDLGRAAVALADRDEGVGMQIMARLFFAAMLSISVRAWDEAAATATEALRLAEESDAAYEEASARGVLAGIELMRADYPAAAGHADAGAVRCVDPGAQALNITFRSAVEADVGAASAAVEDALVAVSLADKSADPIRVAYATAYAAHAQLLAGDLDAARLHAERAVEVLSPMLVLQPWPLSMLAEIEARSGNLDRATELATRASALAATTDVVYQRGLALRAEALVDAARGDVESALDKLTVALSFARRTTGEGYAFHWPIAWILDSLAELAASVDPAASRRWAEALLVHANAVGMCTFIERGQRLLHDSSPR